MRRNQVFEAVIEDVQFPNKGIVRIDGQKVLIAGGLKGQKVRARVTKKKGGRVEAIILEVLEKAPEEIAPRCEHFGQCGGCIYQNLPYEYQVELKAKQVRSLLEKAEIAGYDFLGIEPSPHPFAYRNKMEFTFGDEEKGGPLVLGLHKKGRFHDLVSVTGCQIVGEDFLRALETVVAFFREKGVPFYHKKTFKGVLRHLVVRRAQATGELLLNLVTTSQAELELNELVTRLQQTPFTGKLVGILHTINDSQGDVVKSDETRILFGRDYILEKILGLTFKISAFSFFQTNSSAAEKLYGLVRQFAGGTEDKVVYDLYCGTGTIAQIMAPLAKKVIGIELVEEAVQAARENAALNGLANCEFIAGDVLEKVDELTERPDLIILDPPRSGVHPKALGKIIRLGAPHIVYVSCKPTSLARDLESITAAGYTVEKVKCVDMFPHTPHVESVVLIKRKYSDFSKATSISQE